MRDDDLPRRRLRYGARRVRLVALALGAAALVAGAGSGVLADRIAHAREETLEGVLSERADTVSAYVERAQTVTRLTARNTVFRDVYVRHPEAAGLAPDDLDAVERDRLDGALRYIESMFPDQVAEACFIDASGRELSRVVEGLVPGMERLSLDESRSAFFAPTLALAADATYQASPYVSPDTGQWVVSSSAPVRSEAGDRVLAVVHFELTLSSLRSRLAVGLPRGTAVRVVDTRTGDVIVDTAAPLADTTAARPGTGRYDVSAWPAAGSGPTGRDVVDGERLLVRRLAVAPGNASAWSVVVASAPGSAWTGGIWPGGVPLLPFVVAVAGVVLLGVAAVGFVENGRLLHRRARLDALTGLTNREGLYERLAALLAAPERVVGPGEHPRVRAVLLADLDRFKQVNDTLGHGAGDELLVEVSGRFAEWQRPDDLVARLGGDEFAVLLDDLDGPHEAVLRARELVHRLDAPVDLDGVQVRVSVSIGVALVGEHGTDAATLLRRADLAMYEAKRRRTGTALFSPSLDTAPAQSLAFETALLRAMERDELVLHYQPQVDVRTGAIHGVEALVRWRHPELGLLSPDKFVPAAEESGLIVGMTKHIIAMALDQVRLWRGGGVDAVVAVNIGARNVADPHLPTDVLQLLAERALPASVLRLELTETDLLGDPDQARGVLQALRDAGIGIAVDDFGTGFASLAQLRNLPFDELKIDKSFVQVLDSAPDASHIVTAVVDLAHGLGLTVTAEGVETAACLTALGEVGCDTAQGYLLSRPLPPDEAYGWMIAHDPASVAALWRHRPRRVAFGHGSCGHRHGPVPQQPGTQRSPDTA